ncbi:uncharacterized protein LOC114338195 [Diabrotica virgifera virgifera]|uniref:Ig-like domain-containing protein n=1 Tax=Diabrotica virgifera virgifera TaxID=50390 RepID=A0ABM5K4M6_DIAVI|nr:uncharacterized protein LOC114338195 [Diabrotica virgifera virgifera]
MSLPFRLNVVEAKARILGPSDLHVKAGSSITLTCLISQGPHDLGTVFWYKGENILETASVRTHISDIVDYTSRVTIENQWSEGLSSKLHISNAHISDSGNYSCVPTIAGSTSVNVHVINGEHPAAMQHGNKNTASLSLSIQGTIVYSLFVIVMKQVR